jgi:4'-phosphopantetheinyl transferase
VVRSSQPLVPGELRIYYAWTDGFARAEAVERCLTLLSDDERARHARFRFERDQHSYLAAHALTRSVLAALAGVQPRELCFEAGEYGRPELSVPQLTPALRFNLSHTAGLVACAVTLDEAVGIDVERMSRRVEIDQLARSVFSDAERAELAELAGEAKRLRFFQLWTLKESYIKAVGRGLSLPLRSISVRFERGRPQQLAFGAPLVDDGTAWWLRVHPLGADHLLAVALSAPASVSATAQEWDVLDGRLADTSLR